MRHKHADMIIAKAENMDLVLLVKLMNQPDFDWVECVSGVKLPFDQERDYFLCLHEHKDYCLHWLNGGSVQDYFEDEWSACSGYDGNNNWSYEHMFMLEEAEYRIAPKKEKRWIAVNAKTGDTSNLSSNEADIIEEYKVGSWQIKEIEVEIINEN